MAKSKEEIMLENLKDTKEIFDENGIEFWLDWGTLLGAMREKKIIEWDDDIDLGMYGEDWEKVLSILPKLQEKGFEIVLIENVQIDREVFFKKIYFRRSGYTMDIWFYQLRGENYILPWMSPINFISRSLNILHYLFSNNFLIDNKKTRFRKNLIETVKCCCSIFPAKFKKFLSSKIRSVFKRFCCGDIVIVPAHYFDKLKTAKFYKMDFKVPSESNAYLEQKYGKGWNVPQKEWGGYRDMLKVH